MNDTPRQASPFAASDPELAAIFDTLTFDEVTRHSRLSPRLRLMVQLAAVIACQGLGQYRALLGAALTAGVTPVEAKEIVYQAVAYLGMAKAFDFIEATHSVLSERGVALPLPAQSTTTAETRAEAGLAVMKRIVGDEAVARLHAATPPDQQHIQDHVAANCFGDYLTRSGLDLQIRELLTFSFLVSVGGSEPQAKSHVGANLKVGNDRARLIDVTTQLLPYIGYPRTLTALKLINEATG